VHKLVVESVATKKGDVFEGIALTPSVSLNHNIYSAEEIDNAKNLGVPLRADMDHSDKIVGEVVYSLDKQNHILNYRATVTDESVLADLNDGTYKVSIEASVEEVAQSCNKKGCYNLLSGLSMEGIGFTRNPGVVTTTLNVVESFQDWTPIKESHCGKCSVIESEEVKKLEDKISELETKLNKATTCKTCGKHKSFS
jgi:hypothetical protein